MITERWGEEGGDMGGRRGNGEGERQGKGGNWEREGDGENVREERARYRVPCVTLYKCAVYGHLTSQSHMSPQMLVTLVLSSLAT